MARLKDLYKTKIKTELKDELKCTNVMSVPKLEKIVFSMGLGKALDDKKYLDNAINDLTQIAGQKPVVCKAKKSVSNFKLREGDKIGLKVTLRKERMYEFLDRLINLAIPRVKDFRGLNPNGFDGRGNYSMGLAEQSVFPEIDTGHIETIQGMNITFVTTAENNEQGRALLRYFGMPFVGMND